MQFSEQTDDEIDCFLFARPNCLRLSYEGYKFFTKELKSYIFTFPSKLTNRQLITLSRHVHYPYYITMKNIVLFSSEDAFLIKLHCNNVTEWLDHLRIVSGD